MLDEARWLFVGRRKNPKLIDEIERPAGTCS